MLASLNKKEIFDYASAQYPTEACGLILNISGKPKFRPCKNIAVSQSDFILDPMDYIRCEDEAEILAVVHSHCDISPKPSQADLVSCEASGLPWVILSVPGNSWHYMQPTGYKAPLSGRVFSHGVLDCYALIRDYYREKYALEIMDFERTEEWWNKGDNLYLDNFAKAGFVKVNNDIKTGDVILMQVGAKVVNHAAIYLGNNIILHHVQKRLSCKEQYGGFWKKNTRLIVRHEDHL